MNLNDLYDEVSGYLRDFDVNEEGEHLWSNHQKATAILSRLTEIHNELSYLEIMGTANPELKKLRTMIVDPTIERFEKIAAFESRKIAARGIEATLER